MVGEPRVSVTCDRCQCVEWYDLDSLSRRYFDMRHLENQLTREGWRLADGLDGETYCPDCAKKEKE